MTAHVWIENRGRQWTPLALEGDRCDLETVLDSASSTVDGSEPPTATSQPRQAPVLRADAEPDSPFVDRIVLVSSRGTDHVQWALIAGLRRRVRINGAALELGMHILSDRDQVALDSGETVFFSTEAPARVEAYPGSSQGGVSNCPRCQTPLDVGQSAVRCPGACGLWYHQAEAIGLTCWTYQPQCKDCGTDTQLDGSFQWTPERLG